MNRRETFLESARAANDRSLAQIESRPSEAERTVADLSPILIRLGELLRRLAAIEARLPPPGDRQATRARGRTLLAWVLGTVLITVLAITAVRPDWALQPRQKAELLLGARLYQRLERMDDRDRLEVLKSLWSEPPPPPAKTD